MDARITQRIVDKRPYFVDNLRGAWRSGTPSRLVAVDGIVPAVAALGSTALSFHTVG
jgi:hypothetical protein